VAAFAQSAAVGPGSNTCVYVIAVFTTCESTEERICIKFVLKSEKPQRKRMNDCSEHTLKMQWVIHKCLNGSVDLKTYTRWIREATPGFLQPVGQSFFVLATSYVEARVGR
jgi:hypothetical protein